MKLPIQALYGWYKTALRHPKYRAWVILGTLVYLLSPIDIAPDILPVIGEIDDVAIVALLVAEVSQLAVETLKQRRSNLSTAAAATGVNTVEVDAVSMQE
jgi:uncharacterized membrane protein YkvA (DUF1232 family)